MRDLPGVELFRDWKDWARQLVSALRDGPPEVARELELRGNFANDAAAAAAGVRVGELYRNGSVVMVRVS